MDALVKPRSRRRILLEMRPALDGYAGIPEQTRLLFQSLSSQEDFQVEGLLQSSTHVLCKGLPGRLDISSLRLARHRQVDQLARVVIMLEQKFLRSKLSVAVLIARRLFGLREKLGRFEASAFRDFIWRRLFAKTLPPSEFSLVTNALFRVARAPWTAMHLCGLLSKFVGVDLFPRLQTDDFDVMITETPYPAKISRPTRMIVRYHDAVPLLLPHTIKSKRQHQSFHYHALRENVRNGAWFACVSDATRRDLISIFPEVEPRSVTVHNIVSPLYFDEPSTADRVATIVRGRLNQKVRARFPAASWQKELPEYLLIVSTLEPRKNHMTLLASWESVRAKSAPGLQMLVVGSLGWDEKVTVSKFLPWIEEGALSLLEEVRPAELRVLYKHARATICPSVAEGFDLSGVEAMMSGGAVIASDIAAHKEIYADAAEYFNPYCADDLSRAINRVLGSESDRKGLIERGATIARRYTADAILPKWKALLAGISCGNEPTAGAILGAAEWRPGGLWSGEVEQDAL